MVSGRLAVVSWQKVVRQLTGQLPALGLLPVIGYPLCRLNFEVNQPQLIATTRKSPHKRDWRAEKRDWKAEKRDSAVFVCHYA